MAVFKQIKNKIVSVGMGRSKTIQVADKYRTTVVKRMIDDLYQSNTSWLTEIICNGLDACEDKKKVEVSYKSMGYGFFTSPVIEIKDYGTGMNDEVLWGVYTNFMESGSSDTNDKVGS